MRSIIKPGMLMTDIVETLEDLVRKLIQANGIRVSSDLPDVTGKTAESLLDCFQDFDAQDAAWNNRPGQGKLGSMGFTYRCVGRVSRLASDVKGT